jgi:glucarate dehydratase
MSQPQGLDRRRMLALAASGLMVGPVALRMPSRRADAAEPPASQIAGPPLKITGLTVTPIALPDPPILAASGCHGPYFLRNIVQLATDAGIVGIAETHGGSSVTNALFQSKEIVLGQNALAYRKFAGPLTKLSQACYAGIELACLDACGKATGRRLCELLGGPVRDDVEFAAYLFFRYAADHPKLLADPRIVDHRGRGERALDQWGEVRTPEATAELAEKFHRRFGFRVMKLKAGVLAPKVEAAALRAIHERLGRNFPLRIDPNARWRVETAVAIGKEITSLPLEYYEDPVAGQKAMAEVRRATGLAMSTNMCVTRFEHIAPALATKPVDVVLADHHYWGGFAGCLALGPLADAAGWKLSQHSNNHAGITMAAMVHLAASVPQIVLASDTHYPWLVEGADIIEGKNLAFQAGRMAIPKGPGLGVSLDPDKLARAHEVYEKCGMRSRDDAYTMRLVEPGWRRTEF